MPTPVMHLALAEEILGGDALPPAVRRLLIQHRGPFLLGNTAPDVQTLSGQKREETHFYIITPPPAPPLPGEGRRAADRGEGRRAADTGEGEGVTDRGGRKRAAYEALFAAHPALACVESLPPAQAAFVAGYVAHLLLDELWLDDVFWPFFLQDWAPWPERAFLHNVLRTWMDRQDQQRLNGTVAPALREAEPQSWLPFADDEHLRAWRDWLVEQLGPGHSVQTAEIFARRMGVSAEDVEAVLKSPQQMDARIFCRISQAALRSFHETGYERSVALITHYLEPISALKT